MNSWVSIGLKEGVRNPKLTQIIFRKDEVFYAKMLILK
jgi:hypothetical protein